MSHLKDISVVIPAAGVGTRLKPHTFNNPKAILRIGDKSILGRILDQIIALGLKKVYIIIGYLGEVIQEHVQAHYPKLDVTFITQTEYNGLGHAVYLTHDKIKKGPILIILGDTIIEADYKKALSDTESWMGVNEVQDPRRFGIVEIEDGLISKLVEKPEKPTSNLAIVGLYYFKESAHLFSCLRDLINKNMRTKNEFQITDAIQLMVKKGEKIKPFPIDSWHDCGKPETLLETNRYILTKYFNKSFRIEHNTVIAPSYVSPKAKISNSVIGPYSTIGDDVEISNAVITDSIINDGAVVKDIVLSESLVGHAASVHGLSHKLNVSDYSEIDFV